MESMRSQKVLLYFVWTIFDDILVCSVAIDTYCYQFNRSECQPVTELKQTQSGFSMTGARFMENDEKRLI